MVSEKSCWTCGHYAFGCFVNNEVDFSKRHDDLCEKWCPEGTKGTITEDEIEESDGAS